MKKDYEPVRKYLAAQFKAYLGKLSPKELYAILGEMESDGILPEKEIYNPDEVLTCEHCRQIRNGRCMDEEHKESIDVGEFCNMQFQAYYEKNGKYLFL